MPHHHEHHQQQHHHRQSAEEEAQIRADEQLAERLQYEESHRGDQQNSYSHQPQNQGNYQNRPPQSSYQDNVPSGNYQRPPQNKQGGPPQGYQQGPPQGYSQGYQQGYQQSPPHGYQQGPPQGYQQSSQHYHQQGPMQAYPGGPPIGDGYRPSNYQGGPPQSQQGQYQGGPSQSQQGQYHGGNQGSNQYQGGSGYNAGPAQGGYIGGPPQQAQHPYRQDDHSLRRKSLLIGINYVGSSHALRGCQQDVSNMREFILTKGYSSDPKNQVIMRDDQNTDPRGQYWPTGKNMLAAMHWLISEPNTCNFLHYSGHGSQVKDPDGDRDSGFDDTIVPVDFEQNGQLDSDKLHKTLVSALAPNSTLFVIFDCCHSGSAIELPFVYRSDADGNVSLMDNVKTGLNLLHEASSLIQGGFTMDKLVHAKNLFAGANTFFKQLQHGNEQQEEGVGEEHFVEDWKSEHKFVTMFSGCRDDQTSADANIEGASVGAMSWAFLQAMKRNPNPTYLSTLQLTRTILGESNYKQVPQLSIGFEELDLSQPLRF